MMRVLWLLAGLLALLLGVAGIVLPLLPTVPFLLLAAWCFARSSERLHLWLINHQRLGPPIRDWQQRGAISTGAKRMASISMLAVFVLSVMLGVAPALLLVQALALGGAATFIWTRPGS